MDRIYRASPQVPNALDRQEAFVEQIEQLSRGKPASALRFLPGNKQEQPKRDRLSALWVHLGISLRMCVVEGIAYTRGTVNASLPAVATFAHNILWGQSANRLACGKPAVGCV